MGMILMHGAAFDESGKIVEREVPAADVPAFVAAGYVIGGIPVEEPADVVAEVAEIVEKPKRGRKAK